MDFGYYPATGCCWQATPLNRFIWSHKHDTLMPICQGSQCVDIVSQDDFYIRRNKFGAIEYFHRSCFENKYGVDLKTCGYDYWWVNSINNRKAFRNIDWSTYKRSFNNEQIRPSGS
jgi:hypothetical protein